MDNKCKMCQGQVVLWSIFSNVWFFFLIYGVCKFTSRLLTALSSQPCLCLLKNRNCKINVNFENHWKIKNGAKLFEKYFSDKKTHLTIQPIFSNRKAANRPARMRKNLKVLAKKQKRPETLNLEATANLIRNQKPRYCSNLAKFLSIKWNDNGIVTVFCCCTVLFTYSGFNVKTVIAG